MSQRRPEVSGRPGMDFKHFGLWNMQVQEPAEVSHSGKPDRNKKYGDTVLPGIVKNTLLGV